MAELASVPNVTGVEEEQQQQQQQQQQHQIVQQPPDSYEYTGVFETDYLARCQYFQLQPYLLKKVSIQGKYLDGRDETNPSTSTRELLLGVSNRDEIVSIYVRRFRLEPKMIEIIAQCVGYCPSIIQVGFWLCDIKSSSFSVLVNMLEKSNVAMFSLDVNPIADETAFAQFSQCDAKALKILSLRENEITEVGAVAISNSLKMNRQLVSLNLNGNRIGLDGCKALTELLKGNQMLCSLSLSRNQLDDECVVTLSKVFTKHMIQPEELNRIKSTQQELQRKDEERLKARLARERALMGSKRSLENLKKDGAQAAGKKGPPPKNTAAAPAKKDDKPAAAAAQPGKPANPTNPSNTSATANPVAASTPAGNTAKPATDPKAKQANAGKGPAQKGPKKNDKASDLKDVEDSDFPEVEIEKAPQISFYNGNRYLVNLNLSNNSITYIGYKIIVDAILDQDINSSASVITISDPQPGIANAPTIVGDAPPGLVRVSLQGNPEITTELCASLRDKLDKRLPTFFKPPVITKNNRKSKQVLSSQVELVAQ